MWIYLRNGKKVRLIHIVFSRATHDALSALAPICPNLTFETDKGEKVKLYELELRYNDWRDLNEVP